MDSGDFLLNHPRGINSLAPNDFPARRRLKHVHRKRPDSARRTPGKAPASAFVPAFWRV